jgi:hypothetical protein
MEDRKERRLALAVAALLSVLAVLAPPIYFDDSEPAERSQGFEVEGIEEGKNFNEGSTSRFYMVELVNGSKHHYWREVPDQGLSCEESLEGCEVRVDPGYMEIESDLSYFRESKEKYLGLDYLPEDKVCARDITQTTIDIYRC